MPEHDLALTDAKKLNTMGRYDGAKSRKFKDICADTDRGGKYNLDDEIELVRGLVARLIKTLEPDDEELATDSLYLRLIKAEFSVLNAKHIVRCVDGAGSMKDTTSLLKELREILKQAAQFEHMMPFAKVKTFLAEVSRITKDEVKDDKIVERIRNRVQLLSI